MVKEIEQLADRKVYYIGNYICDLFETGDVSIFNKNTNNFEFDKKLVKKIYKSIDTHNFNVKVKKRKNVFDKI